MTTVNRVAVVTGAGSGIGRAVTLALVGDGYDVLLAGRDPGALARTAATADGPGTATPVVTDVRDAAAVEALFARVEGDFGRLDVLFNNAGVFGPSAPVDEVSDDDWAAVVDTNLTGAFRCARAAFRLMRRQTPQGGRIINNGSVSAHTPRPNAIAYTTTKHAMTGLTKALSLDGRAHHIACGQIDIGNAATALTEHMRSGVPQADGTRAAEATFDVAHVAELVLYLANLPTDVNVPFLTMMANEMPFIGRG